MLSSGMPELQKATREKLEGGNERLNIEYISEQLYLDRTDSYCIEQFMKEIKKASGDVYKIVDNFLHNLKH